MQHPRRVGMALASVLLLAGCADYSELQFVKDERLTFTEPASRELVTTPLRISWSMEDFTVVEPGQGEPTDDAGYFAVFVDRAPVEPGHTLEDVAGRDEACKRDPSCPDARYLADRGVYTTTKSSLTVELIAALPSKEDVQLHDVTVVLLDSEGRRIGEAAWYRQFKMENRTFE